MPKPTGNKRPLGGKKHHFLYLQRFENEAGATGVGIVLMPSHVALQVDARGINEMSGLVRQTLGKGGTGMISTIMRSTGRPPRRFHAKKLVGAQGDWSSL